MKYIYIAGPLEKPDPAINARIAVQISNEVLNMGYIPFCPHLSLFWQFLIDRPYQDWINYDLEWLKKCDALIRIPGESKGADIECEAAKKMGIPVFFGLHNFIDYSNQKSLNEQILIKARNEYYSRFPNVKPEKIMVAQSVFDRLQETLASSTTINTSNPVKKFYFLGIEIIPIQHFPSSQISIYHPQHEMKFSCQNGQFTRIDTTMRYC